MNSLLRAGLVCSTVALGVTSLVACGGSSSNAKSSATPSASSSAAGRGGGGAGGGGAGADLRTLYNDPQVKACLSAAGIAVPTFAARPSGSGTRPSFSSGERPSNFPSGARPSGARGSGFAGAGGGDFTKIEAALKACGIAVPTFTPRSGAAAPSATPSS